MGKNITNKRPVAAPATETRKRTGKKIKKNSALVFITCLLAMVLIFGGRWVWAITETYYAAFVERYEISVEEATANMSGLSIMGTDAEALKPLQQEWDLFTASRLCDEVNITSYDGTALHGYLYNEGSDITVVVVPHFHEDGTADFLPGAYLNELTGCNILLPDPRNHGQSEGNEFGFGYYEQHDLVCWLEWAEKELGAQRFVLWGDATGANTILFAEANSLLPESVVCAVAESAYSSLHTLAKTQIREWYSVPAFPFLTAIEGKVNRKAGFTMNDTDLTAVLATAECDLPVLFLDSEKDTNVFSDWSEDTYTLYSGEKLRISGTSVHGTAYAEKRSEIHAALSAWLG